jgi:hypothetical protein
MHAVVYTRTTKAISQHAKFWFVRWGYPGSLSVLSVLLAGGPGALLWKILWLIENPAPWCFMGFVVQAYGIGHIGRAATCVF